MQGQSLVLVQELCATDVHSLLHAACGPLPPSVVKRFMRDLLRGVEHLHSCGALPPCCLSWRTLQACHA